jgi:hypothetical protein
MELGHLLTSSGLTYTDVSSKVCHDSSSQLGNRVSSPWVVYYEANGSLISRYSHYFVYFVDIYRSVITNSNIKYKVHTSSYLEGPW